MKITPDFWNGMAKQYAAQPVENPNAYAHKLEKTRELFTPDMQVLEMACGTGSTAIEHAPYVKSIRAIDFSSEMITIAKNKAEAAGVSNVDFAVQSIDDLPPDQQFDMVQAHSILHLLPDYPTVLDKVFTLTKPGGYFISSTACMDDMNPLFRIALPVARWLGKAPHVSFFTGTEIVTEIQRAGFAIEYEWRPDPKSAIFVMARKPA